MSNGHCCHYCVIILTTQLSKPDMKPVNNCFQEVLFSEVLHLPLMAQLICLLMTQLTCQLMTHVPLMPLHATCAT